MEHFSIVQRIIRAASTGASVAKPVTELSLLLADAAEVSQAPADLEAARWARRWALTLKEDRKSDGPTRHTEVEAEMASRTDPVQGLLRRGSIGSFELAGCHRLERMFGILAAGLDVQARDYGAPRVDAPRKYRHPADRMTESEAVELNLVFRPWSWQMQKINAGLGFVREVRRNPPWSVTPAEMWHIVISGGTMDAPISDHGRVPRFMANIREVPLRAGEKLRARIGLTVFDLVRRVLVDRQTLRGLEREHRCRNGMLTPAFVTAVRHYMRAWDAADVMVGFGLADYLVDVEPPRTTRATRGD